MLSGDVPKHLTIGARTGFLTAIKEYSARWQRVAMTVQMGAKSIDIVDLGGAPMPVNSKAGNTVQQMIEKSQTLTVESWDITIFISRDALEDDQTGTLERRVRGAGRNFSRHMNKRVFETLNGGDGTTYGLCYDGQEFFDSDHVDAGAQYQTDQDNEYALALSLDNFETVMVAAKDTVDDMGVYTEYMYDLLVCNPALERTAANITGNPNAYDTGNNEVNPYSGRVQYITSPYYDSTAWHLIASNEPIKPIIVAMREMPTLLASWYDPKQPEGGYYYFKYYGRYEMHYGDWRLAYQGNT